MDTSELVSQVDKIWKFFWTDSMTNQLTVIKQLSSYPSWVVWIGVCSAEKKAFASMMNEA